MATDNIFHPNLLGEVFASRHRSILLKSDLWLEEKYGMDLEMQKRKLPPRYDYIKIDEEGNPTGESVPKLLDFNNTQKMQEHL